MRTDLYSTGGVKVTKGSRSWLVGETSLVDFAGEIASEAVAR